MFNGVKMTIIIYKWRFDNWIVLITQGEEVLFHDTSTTEVKAKSKVIRFLSGRYNKNA